MGENHTPGEHKLLLNGRKNGSVSGISDVLSFDENVIIMDTEMGLLTIKGKNLHVSRLSLESGEAQLEGQVDSLFYSARGHKKKKEGSLVRRIFS